MTKDGKNEVHNNHRGNNQQKQWEGIDLELRIFRS